MSYVTVSAEVDIDDVLEEARTKDLVRELEQRRKSGDTDALAAFNGAGPVPIKDDDLDEMRELAAHGRANALVSFVANLLCVHQPRRSPDGVYAALPRDPDTGRPVIN